MGLRQSANSMARVISDLFVEPEFGGAEKARDRSRYFIALLPILAIHYQWQLVYMFSPSLLLAIREVDFFILLLAILATGLQLSIGVGLLAAHIAIGRRAFGYLVGVPLVLVNILFGFSYPKLLSMLQFDKMMPWLGLMFALGCTVVWLVAQLLIYLLCPPLVKVEAEHPLLAHRKGCAPDRQTPALAFFRSSMILGIFNGLFLGWLTFMVQTSGSPAFALRSLLRLEGQGTGTLIMFWLLPSLYFGYRIISRRARNLGWSVAKTVCLMLFITLLLLPGSGVVISLALSSMDSYASYILITLSLMLLWGATLSTSLLNMMLLWLVPKDPRSSRDTQAAWVKLKQ